MIRREKETNTDVLIVWSPLSVYPETRLRKTLYYYNPVMANCVNYQMGASFLSLPAQFRISGLTGKYQTGLWESQGASLGLSSLHCDTCLWFEWMDGGVDLLKGVSSPPWEAFKQRLGHFTRGDFHKRKSCTWMGVGGGGAEWPPGSFCFLFLRISDSGIHFQFIKRKLTFS